MYSPITSPLLKFADGWYPLPAGISFEPTCTSDMVAFIMDEESLSESPGSSG